jgi:hypothetical protein
VSNAEGYQQRTATIESGVSSWPNTNPSLTNGVSEGWEVGFSVRIINSWPRSSALIRISYQLDDDKHIIVLFAIHQASIEILKHHPYVISMDCTYKTNQFGLPLLDIVGFTATGASAYLGFAFVQNEQQPTYEIALNFVADMYDQLELEYPRTILTDKENGLINAINTVFPNSDTIICIWHVNMNLMKKALPILRDQIAIARRDGLPLPEGYPPLPAANLNKKELEKELQIILDEGWNHMLKRWNRVVYAETEEAFDTAWSHFQAKYDAPIFTELVAYIQDEWVDDCPANFLRHHTRRYLHLGEAATSRTGMDRNVFEMTGLTVTIFQRPRTGY